MRRSLVIIACCMLAAGSAWAAQQLVPTKTLVVKNPPSGARKVLWKVRETASAATIVGNPAIDGATLRLVLTDGGDQCARMPASGWSAIGMVGFKYKDVSLTNGPVKIAMLKKSPSGTLVVKALLRNGGSMPITLAPGDPTTTYGTNFTLGVGDDYCGGTATATPNPNNATTFRVSDDSAPTACVLSCRTTTTTSTSSTSTTLPSRTCCEWTLDVPLPGSSWFCAWADDPGSCPEGTPGEPGTVCDGVSGRCIPQPARGGDCCQPNNGEGPCFGGPLYPVYCALYANGGEPHPDTICAEDGQCVASPGGAFVDAPSVY